MADREFTNINGIKVCDQTARDKIPTKTSQLTNDSGYITNIPDEYITETELNAKGYATTSQMPTVPTNVSEFTNDANYASQTYVNNKIAEASLSGGQVDLSGYVTRETGNANQITFTDGQTFQAKLEAGILKGEKGDRGVQGPQGPAGANGTDGQTPNITIGTVTTLGPGTNATAEITGATPNLTLNLGIPKGADGAGGSSTGGTTDTYGIIADGVTDNSNAIRTALNSNKHLVLPSGKIYLGSSIELDSNTSITSKGDTEIILHGIPAFTCNGTLNNSTTPPKVTFKENIRISNLRFTSTTNGVALNFKSVNKVRIHDCTTKNMGLLNLNSSFEADARWDKDNDPILACGIVNDDCLSNDIQIYNNVIYGNLEGDRPIGIMVAYVKDVVIQGNIIRHVVDGVRIWGGDVGNSYSRDEMFRPCRYITVSNNLIEDVVGGIWAGRGEYITFTGNTVNRTTDVALDFEGCYSCTAVGNIVTDSRNGAMGVMFSAKKISFIGNTCTDTGALDQGVFMFCQTSDSNLKMEVYYANNTYISKVRMLGCDFQDSLTGSIILENNVFYNATLGLGGTTYTKIKNNTFWVDPTLSQDYWQPAKAPLINITGMSNLFNPEGLHRYNYEIVGNEFRNATPTGLNDTNAVNNRPIKIKGSRWRQSMRVLIKDNKITGFNTSIAYEPTADNASDQSILFIELINNLISGEIVNEGVNSHARIYYENNKKINESENAYITQTSLSNYPNAIPAANDKYFWVKGTKIYFDEPDTDGYLGAICTVSGDPGTWKRFGKTS